MQSVIYRVYQDYMGGEVYCMQTTDLKMAIAKLSRLHAEGLKANIKTKRKGEPKDAWQ
jgi:hypothetical protein